ncbi:sensor histidine kinase [Microbacterium pumilum]|uniref:histidine kinase n=1 Tax=Microbacterium pumilum TaxID=344165 RepID=A0ABN2SZP3_9MICO
MSAEPGGRPRGLSVRWKLTLSYAGFLVVAGIALFVVGFLLLRFVPEGNLSVDGGGFAPNRTNLLEVFVRYAWWAMGLLVLFGLVGGWLLAGVVLRPLDRITDAARRARDGQLDHRVALPGLGDELTDLADTFDAMLDRVVRTIDEERRFAANASHELRTPHAIIRTMVEVAQADPDGRDVDILLQRIGTTNDRAIAMTEALLTLARVGRGEALEASQLDLAALVGVAVDELRPDAAAPGIRMDTSLEPALVNGNSILLGRLATNLVSNGIVHNVPGGWVRVTVRSIAGATELVVENSGAVIDQAVAVTLTEAFVRGSGRVRSADADHGAGLGLAIVASIVRAHDGTLQVVARHDGGLQVRVTLPR